MPIQKNETCRSQEAAHSLDTEDAAFEETQDPTWLPRIQNEQRLIGICRWTAWQIARHGGERTRPVLVAFTDIPSYLNNV